MKQTALITGASSGIGTEFAYQLAKRNINIILVARRLQLLEAIAEKIKTQHEIEVSCIAVDLSDPQGRQNLYDEITKQSIRIDWLINNAGFGTMGAFTEQSAALEQQEIALNSAAVVDLCHQYLPPMLEQRQGTIINVASVAAFHAVPYMAVYAATKAFLLSFSEALWAEYQHQGIRITALCPGPVDTGFFDATDNLLLKKTKRKVSLMPPSEVVSAALKAIDKGQALVIPGTKNKMAPFISRLFSHARMSRIVEKAMKPSNR